MDKTVGELLIRDHDRPMVGVLKLQDRVAPGTGQSVHPVRHGLLQQDEATCQAGAGIL